MVDLNKFINENVKNSVGCTEPAAIGLSVAAAMYALKGILPDDYVHKTDKIDIQDITENVISISVKTDRGIYKNAFSVGISRKNGQTVRGIETAAALGAFCDPGKELELFIGLTDEQFHNAYELINKNKVKVAPNYKWDQLHIEAEIKIKGRSSKAWIIGEHSNIDSIEVNDKIVYKKTKIGTETGKLKRLTEFSDFIGIIESNLSDTSKGIAARATIEEILITNHKASLDAEKIFKNLRIDNAVGIAFKDFSTNMDLGQGCIDLAQQKTALTIEARMSGSNVLIRTCAGSGNMGICSTLPLIALAIYNINKDNPNQNIEWNSATEAIRRYHPEKWARLLGAVALVHLITNYISLYSGKISAICGCGFKVGIGLTVGVVYYLCSEKNMDISLTIQKAINGMSNSVAGMICDGAKESCALKGVAGVAPAIESAMLACRGGGSYERGIFNRDNGVKTLQDIGKFFHRTLSFDKQIINYLNSQSEKITI
ncbi:MAG: L-serine ammonia-lyase, iron-sulfur-dependent, subunit alpha [Spirochaetes bacterium]|nr:L-serine ammonia-lyase, iron-sulfur-dependent, subunit alpha [Spirochaetota bacterium]